jgi:hypothetical protein
MTRRPSPAVFVIELAAAPGTDGIRPLRILLKSLLRHHGFRCIACEAVNPQQTKETIMGLGKRKTDYTRLAKWGWDFALGKSVFEDRIRGELGDWETVQRNIENDQFRAAADLENLEIGWIAYLKGEGLNAKLVPVGQDYGERPTKEHKEGLRLVAKMDESLGGEIRELVTTASTIWAALDALHDDECTAGVEQHPGHLPVVAIAGVHEEPGAQSTLLRVPDFRIVDWAPRPVELPACG